MTEHHAMSEIRVRQRLERNLRRQLAARVVYRQAKGLHAVGATVAILLAATSPVVLVYRPQLGPLLGAVAGAWIFVSRLLLEPWRLRRQRFGAAAQELFDCDVLGLPWNPELVGAMPSEEEISSASRKDSDIDAVRSWYPADDDMPWPESVLVCQRSNAVWARRQHAAYGKFLTGAAGVWAIVGMLIALLHDASLATYLTSLALPSLPALLDAAELAQRHGVDAARRQRIEETTDQLLHDQHPVPEQRLREIQDALFQLRREAPLVPEWFYKLLAGSLRARYALRRRPTRRERTSNRWRPRPLRPSMSSAAGSR